MRALGCFVFILVVFTTCDVHVGSIDEQIASLQLETLPETKHPFSNPLSPAKQELGKMLFYDPILSGEHDIACATCHLPDHGYADGLDLSIGVGGVGKSTNRVDNSNGRIPVLSRNSPTIVNTAFNGIISGNQNYDPLLAPMFWDGRKKSLENQCAGPPTSFNIMRGNGYAAAVTYDSILARLQSIPEYDLMFTNAFNMPNSITKENIANAIACFERTIISINSPYDRYVRGDRSALTPDQKLGLQLFYTKANCVNCHSGPMFSDYNYYNLGIAYNPKSPTIDKGFNNQFLFRTPTLRNVAITAPYMHNGMLRTLEDVMDHYIRANSSNADINFIDPKIQKLNLNSTEISAILAFLNALTDDGYDKEMPDHVPSGLKPGGN